MHEKERLGQNADVKHWRINKLTFCPLNINRLKVSSIFTR